MKIMRTKIYDNSANFSMDQGGIAIKVDVGLGLPEVDVSHSSSDTEADQEQQEKHKESLMRKESQLHVMEISEKTLPKDTQIITVSAHDNTNELIVHEEDADDGYSSSNRESKLNSRSNTPFEGPELEDSPNSVESKGRNKMGKGSASSSPVSKLKESNQKREQAKVARVVPKAGLAWKGMQGEQM